MTPHRKWRVVGSVLACVAGAVAVAWWAARVPHRTPEVTTAATAGLAIGLIVWAVTGAKENARLRRELEKRARELQISEERHRILLEQAGDAILVADADTGAIVEVNRYCCELLGWQEKELLGERHTVLHPEAERSEIRQAFASLTAPGQVVEEDVRVRCRAGEPIPMQIRAALITSGGRRYVQAIMRDLRPRLKAEEASLRYKLLFESAVEGVYETTPEGAVVSVNPALARMLGYGSPERMMEALRKRLDGFYAHPRRREEFFRALGDRETLTAFESEIRRADGTTRWVSENVRAVRDNEGRILRLQGFVADVTERRKAEDAIRASEERYRVLFEHSPVAVVEYDYREIRDWLNGLRRRGVTDLAAYLDEHPEELKAAYGKVVLVGMNQETVRLARAKSKQELMDALPRVFTAEAYLARRDAFLALWDGQNEIEGEIPLITLEGTTRRVYYRWWLPQLEGSNSFEWTQVVLVDLTDIRSTEAELAAERERLRVTLRAMAEGLLTTDTDGVVQFMNEAAERITGWSAGAAVGRGVEQVCVLRHEKTRAGVAVPVAQAVSEHRVVDFPLQTMLVNRAGGVSLIDGRCAPMHDLQGRAIGAVIVFRDVTERARLEAEQMRSSKLESVGILAGGIAHDFNNILTVVMGNVTLAMLDSQVMQAAGNWLTEAERGVMRARDLTQQLLTFAKGGEPIRKAVHLPDVVREAAEFARHGSKVRCEFAFQKDLWAANVDKGQIGQVVQNLVINAVQAMPEGGIVSLTLRNEEPELVGGRPLSAGHYLLLSIADSGMGIRPEHLGRIFDPYFTTKQSGSGLGLATVYSIVRKHQGHIEVDSQLGKGTTFQIWLPAAREAKPATTDASAKPMRLSGRVLFMDDEETIRRLAQSLLSRLGLDVTAVADGAEAVKAYSDAQQTGHPFSVVIMDLTVPAGMGGLEAMRELLKLDPQVRAIVSSGYSSDPVLANYRAHGFYGMVPKPYQIGDLARTIQSALERAA